MLLILGFNRIHDVLRIRMLLILGCNRMYDVYGMYDVDAMNPIKSKNL